MAKVDIITNVNGLGMPDPHAGFKDDRLPQGRNIAPVKLSIAMALEGPHSGIVARDLSKRNSVFRCIAGGQNQVLSSTVWPSLTIVMAAFNEEEALPVCAERTLAFLDAHVSDGELIIVNDGSSDRTAEVIRELESADPRVVGRHLEQNAGMGAALLDGYGVASKEWIAMMPADGQIDAFEFLEFFKVADNADVVTSLYSNREYSLLRKPRPTDLVLSQSGCRNPGRRGSYMVRRSILEI